MLSRELKDDLRLGYHTSRFHGFIPPVIWSFISFVLKILERKETEKIKVDYFLNYAVYLSEKFGIVLVILLCFRKRKLISS